MEWRGIYDFIRDIKIVNLILHPKIKRKHVLVKSVLIWRGTMEENLFRSFSSLIFEDSLKMYLKGHVCILSEEQYILVGFRKQNALWKIQGLHWKKWYEHSSFVCNVRSPLESSLSP